MRVNSNSVLFGNLETPKWQPPSSRTMDRMIAQRMQAAYGKATWDNFRRITQLQAQETHLEQNRQPGRMLHHEQAAMHLSQTDASIADFNRFIFLALSVRKLLAPGHRQAENFPKLLQQYGELLQKIPGGKELFAYNVNNDLKHLRKAVDQGLKSN